MSYRCNLRFTNLFHFLFIVYGCASACYCQVATNIYTFDFLANGGITGQDNWNYQPNNISIPNPGATIVATQSSGAYTGGKGVYMNIGAGGGEHAYATRKNDLVWGYAIPAISDYLIIEFDYNNNNWWGEFVQLTFDKNVDGNFNQINANPDLNEYGVGLQISCNTPSIIRANGTAVAGVNYPFAGSGWTKYRLTIDLRVAGGMGYVCYKNLESNGAWQSVSGLQGVPMLINPGSPNQDNLQNLNGVAFHQEAGGYGTLDNLCITTISNNIMPPAQLCVGETLMLSSISIPEATSYKWIAPNGNEYITNDPTFMLPNVEQIHDGIWSVVTNDCPGLTWSVNVDVICALGMPILDVNAVCDGVNRGISWQLHPDFQFDYFEIHSLKDGAVFHADPTMCEVEENSFYYELESSNEEVYLLTGVDVDGRSIYLGDALFNCEEAFIKVNTTNDHLQVIVNSQTESDGAIQLYNVTGALLDEKVVDFSVGTNTIVLSDATIASGYYVLRLRHGKMITYLTVFK